MARPHVYPTEAIPLKRMDYGEADRILTVFTPGYGKLRLLAKGVRKSTSRMAGHLELFTHTHVMVVRGRDLSVATQASTIQPFRELREDLLKSSYAYHLAELVDAFLQDHDEHAAVFDLLRSALAALSAGGVRAELVARHFEVQLLGEVGFRPQLTACLACQEAIQPQPNAYSVFLGGVVCPRCAPSVPSASAIPLEGLKLLRFLQRTRHVSDVTITAPAAILKEVERVLHGQLEFVLERRLRATDFVHHVSEAAASYAT